MAAKEQMSTYDPQYVLPAFGLINTGVTCYFNSVIQALASCSSFIKTVAAGVDEKSITHPFLIEFARLSVRVSQEPHPLINPEALAKIVFDFAAGRGRALRGGQQCASECLTLIFDMLESVTPIARLFAHRHLIQIVCPSCVKIISNKTQDGYLNHVQPDLKLEGARAPLDIKLNDALVQQVGIVEGFRCSTCEVRAVASDIMPKRCYTSIIMAPEILIVLSKKYAHDKILYRTGFTERLEFNGKRGVMKYQAIAQIEYSGTAASGHYWAICRREGVWCRLDDGSLSPASFGATENTFIVLYHLTEIIPRRIADISPRPSVES